MNTEHNEVMKYMRLQTRILCAILVIVILVSIFACVTLSGVSAQLKSINVEMLNEAAQSLRDAAMNLRSLDVESLNGMIESMEKMAANMESTSSIFSGWFGN